MTHQKRVEAVANAIYEIRKGTKHVSNNLIKEVCRKYKVKSSSVRMVAGWK